MSPREDVILLTGCTGQVGYELARSLAPLGNIIAPRHNEMDLADVDAIRRYVRALEPTLIVNAAAYTKVDKAEEEPALAMAVNGTAPGILAEEAKRAGIPLVHYSTDYVFAGRGKDSPGKVLQPYRETDLPAPLCEYGRSKLAGEQAIQAVDPVHLILRTSWVYANRGANFMLTVRRLAAERDELRMVDDQTGSPTWARSIAQATAKIFGEGRARRETYRNTGSFLAESGGLFHLSATGSTTWCGFARAIIGEDAAADRGRKVPVTAITTSEYPLPAERPDWSVLDNGAIKSAFGIDLPDWREQLSACAAEPGTSGKN
jgi:dTDP-4-dehydrorhamnose reductase